MKFKLDENFGQKLAVYYKSAGFDVHTVFDERLTGASDETLFKVVCKEQRILLTLDLDFSDVYRFSSTACGSIVVFRPPKRYNLETLTKMTISFIEQLRHQQPINKLWIVEIDRIRIHQTE